MGGLRRLMPVTFVTYAIGMMALSGVPLFFFRWLDQGGNPSRHRALAAIACTVLPDAGRRRSHSPLYDAANDLRLFWESPERC